MEKRGGIFMLCTPHLLAIDSASFISMDLAQTFLIYLLRPLIPGLYRIQKGRKFRLQDAARLRANEAFAQFLV